MERKLETARERVGPVGHQYAVATALNSELAPPPPNNYPNSNSSTNKNYPDFFQRNLHFEENAKPRKRTIQKLSDESVFFLFWRKRNIRKLFRPRMGVRDYIYECFERFVPVHLDG